MRILGKYKDYYDYLQGIYGVDPLQIFDRRYEDMLIRKPDEEGLKKLISKRFFVAGKSYDMHYYNGKSYYTLDELNELNQILRKNKQQDDCISMPWKFNYNKKKWWKAKSDNSLTQEWWDDIQGKDTNINMKARNPVLVASIKKFRQRMKISNDYTPCILEQWDFHKVLTAEEAYKEISAMISYFVDNPEIPNKQSNKEKILSHGFDMKKSFRHRK